MQYYLYVISDEQFWLENAQSLMANTLIFANAIYLAAVYLIECLTPAQRGHVQHPSCEQRLCFFPLSIVKYFLVVDIIMIDSGRA